MRSLQSIWVFVVQSLKDSGKKAKSKDPINGDSSRVSCGHPARASNSSVDSEAPGNSEESKCEVKIV